jgi:uncharacterized protein (DUF2062 family)
MGIFPIWGFQMLTALALSFVFRLNKVLVILASNISFGPMTPIIIFISHRVGAIWMGDRVQQLSFSTDITFAKVKADLLQYVAGAITLAMVAGVIFGIVTYAFLKINKQLKRSGPLPPGS